MANNDYVVRLTGDSKGLNNAVKSAQNALNNLGKENQQLDKIRDRFDKIQSSTAPLNRKIRDIKKAMEDLAVSGQHTTKEGKEMWEKLSAEAKKYDETLKKIQADTKSVPDLPSAKGGGFDIKGMATGLADKAGLGGVTSQLGGLAAMANPATIAVAAVGSTMIAAGKAAADFEVHLDSLQALTGLSTEAMKGVSDTALDMSKKFGISANDIVDAMGLIGSQAPELLKDADALASVTEAAMTLAKAGSISAEAAGSAITTVVNQMGVLPSEAMNIANALEAAEQQGSASVEYLNTAFEKAGTQAKAAGMSYTDLAAMIETVAPKFSSADVAGSQLSSTLLKLSMGADEFNPAVVGMSQALQNLADAQLTNEQLSKMVGEANITMIKTMIDGKAAFDGFSTSLVGTNSAVESAQIKSDNFSGAIDKLKASWDAFLITLGQSGIIQGIADNVMAVMDALNAVMDVLGDVIKSFEDFGITSDNTINPLKAQLNLLVKVIQGIGIALQIIVKIAAKVFNGIKNAVFQAADWIGDKWTKLKNLLGDTAFGKLVINTFNKIMNAVRTVCNKVKEWWNKMLDFLGIEGGHFEIIGEVKIDDNVGNGTQATNTVAGGNNGTITAPDINVGGGGSGRSRTGTGRTTTTSTPKSNEPKFEVGSIKALEAEVTALNNELNNTVVSDERLKEILAEKDALEEQINALKIRNGLMKAPVEKSKLEQNRETYNKANQTINQVKADFKVGLISKEDAEKAIADANKELEGIGLKPLELHVNSDGTITTTAEEIAAAEEKIEKYKNKMSDMSSQIGTIGDAFSEMGEAVGGTGGKMMEFAGQTLQAASEIIPQIVKLIAAKQAEAMASAEASAAALPFPANIATMASIIATVVSLFASIPKTFAEGGLIGGNSIHGDTMLARVNSGEMILNHSQQSNLYRAIKNNNIGSGGLSGNVEFKISGSTLKGCLNNYDNKMKKLK